MDSPSKRLEELKKIVLSTDENPDSEERSEGIEDARNEGDEKG